MNLQKGKLIVIEGLDGSGKATQAGLLTQALKDAGRAVRAVSFPDYASESSALVKMYLSGAFGVQPSDVNAYAASSFYAVDRFASFRRDWGNDYRSGGIIVADRYTTSNAVHQCSKLPRAEWDGFLDWLFHYEYALLGIPAPDVVIYLSVDPALSQALMRGRYHGDDSRRDIHERNLEYLRRSRDAAEYCAKHLGWRVVQCAASGVMRSAEDIHREIMGIVRDI